MIVTSQNNLGIGVNLPISGGDSFSDKETVLIIGDVIWITGYTFLVIVEKYKKLGLVFEEIITKTITLDPADDTLDRKDTFVLNLADSGDTIGVEKGTLSNDPFQAPLNLETQLEIGWALVTNNTTQPVNTSVENVYLEGVEWNITGGHASIAPLSTDDPITDTKSILHTNTPQNTELFFDTNTPQFTSSETVLLIDIKLATVWEFKRSKKITIDVYLWKGNSRFADRLRIGSDSGFGFDGNNTTTVQTLALRLSRFDGIYSQNDFDKIRFHYKRTDNEIFRIDNIRLVTGFGGNVNIESEYSLTPLDANNEFGLTKKGVPLSPKVNLTALKTKYLGLYPSLGALQTAHPTALAGNYANVDTGVANDVKRYLWDADDAQWVLGSGGSSSLAGVHNITTSDDPQTIFDAAPAGDLVRFLPGTHTHGINNNSRTEDAILYAHKSMNIELMAGAILKLSNNTTTLLTDAEITTNQGVSKDLEDLSMGGTSSFTGNDKVDFFIEITTVGTPDKFTWGFREANNTDTIIASNVSITGSEQTLQDGVKIQFAATTGHNINSLWYISFDGKAHYGIRVGTGTHITYIEDVNIYGEGIIDLNIANNVQTSIFVPNISSAILFAGRVRNCSVKDITMQNAHRTFLAYGDSDGTYGDLGEVNGGTSFDCEYIDILNTKSINTIELGYGILLGHPSHRGLLKYIRCNGNYIKSLNTALEPNYLLREYELLNNTIDGAPNGKAIFMWRRSDNGLIMGNILINDSGSKSIVQTSSPGGWELARNIAKINNYNLNTSKQEPFPPHEDTTDADSATINLIANYPLQTNSDDGVGTLHGTDTNITYSSAAIFNGASSDIDLPDDNIFSFTDGSDLPFTITMRVKFDDTTSAFLINKVSATDSQQEYYLFWDDASGKLHFNLFSANSNSDFIRRRYTWSKSIATWYNIGITYDGSRLASGMKIYIDGIEVGTTETLGTYVGMSNSTAPVTLGVAGWTEAHRFDGSMKNLRFYTGEKSVTGIIAINAL